MNARISLISLLAHAGLLAVSMAAQASPVVGLPPLRTDAPAQGAESEMMRLGNEALRAGQLDKAEKAFREANRLNPSASEPMLGLATVAQGLGKTELALQAYQSAATLAPSDPLPSALRGRYLEQLKRLAEAEIAYRDALRAKGDHPGVLNNLAMLLASQKIQLGEALGFAKAAVQANPTQANYYDTLGVVQQAMGDAPAARQSFEKALALKPDNAGFKQHLDQLGVTAASAPKGPSSAPVQARPVAVPAPKVSAAVGLTVPPPQAAKTMVAAVDPAKAVGPALEAWRQAWQAKDVVRYLDSYAKGFVPDDKKSRAAWEADRRAKLAKKGEIQIGIQQAVFSMTGNTVVVSFEQKYQSSNFSDSTRKQMEWVNEGNVWRIQREVQR